MHRCLPFVFVAVLAFAGARLGAATPAVPENAGEPVRMSPFEVSANSVDFKSWLKVGSPHFVLYTDAKEKEARQVLREFELLRLAAQRFFRRRAQNLPPAVVVLPTSHSDWRKIESKGGVDWRVAVSVPSEQLLTLVLTQYEWQGEGLWIVHSALSQGLVRGLNLHGPFWFERGIGALFETAEFRDDTVQIGRQSRRTLSVINEGPLPWGKFFAVTPRSPEFTKEGQVHRFDGQCAMFVQFMLTNPDTQWAERLMAWVSRLNAGGEPTEEAFKADFGQDWKTWQRTIDSFMNGGHYNIASYQLPKALADFPITTFELPVREMRELFVLAQVLNQNVPASDDALNSLLARGLKTEALREVLAEACIRRQRPAAALEQLRLLAEADSPNPAVYTTSAMVRFRERVPVITIHARFGEEADEIRKLFNKAIALDPTDSHANNLLAWVEALGPKVDAGNVAAIEKTYRALTGYAATSDAVAAHAVAAWRMGDKAWARKLAKLLADSPYADHDGKRVSGQLLEVLGPE